MSSCSELTIKKMAEDPGPWILVENKGHSLVWASKCDNDNHSN